MKVKRFRAWDSQQKQAVVPFPAVVDSSMCADNTQCTVVAFHTDDAFYTHEARRFCASAARLNIDVYLKTITNTGDWVKNTSLKAEFLQTVRQTMQGPVLYVDVDAVFHCSPLAELTRLECDIAVHFDDDDGHLMSGTLLIHDTPAAHELMRLWNERCQQQPERWDQAVLEDILQADKDSAAPQYRVARLPVVFCWVFDRGANRQFQAQQPVYIEHLQASREGREKRRILSSYSKATQRRMERVKQIEAILF